MIVIGGSEQDEMEKKGPQGEIQWTLTRVPVLLTVIFDPISRGQFLVAVTHGQSAFFDRRRELSLAQQEILTR